jgi:hypothetical protein
MLTTEERDAVSDCVRNFAVCLINATAVDEQAVHNELDTFFEFFCKALEIARTDGIVRVRESIGTSNN